MLDWFSRRRSDLFRGNAGGVASFGDFALVDITFTDGVPEPSTSPIMLLGFAGLGFMAYRRKPRATLMAA